MLTASVPRPEIRPFRLRTYGRVQAALSGGEGQDVMDVGNARLSFGERPTRRNHCGRSEHWIFKAWGNLLRWNKNRRTR
jgi:hypothetical protein